MFDFLTMEQSLGMNLDDYTYAEASQMYAEHGREQWQHTASQIAYIVRANTTSKKKFKPEDFNPWEQGTGAKTQGIKLTRENLHVMKNLANGL